MEIIVFNKFLPTKEMFKKGILYFVTLLQLSAVLVLANKEEHKVEKPFGLGQGPFYVGGRDTDEEGTKIALNIYQQFLDYKKLMAKSFLEDEYYER